MRPIAVLALLACVGTVKQVAAASACPEPGRSWVELSFLGNHEPALEHRIEQHLRVELLRGNLDLCLLKPQAQTLPLSRLQIEFLDGNHTELRMWVSDLTSESHQGRQLSLAGLPKDTHAMAVALGMVELLHATSARGRREELTDDTKHRQVLGGGVELRFGGEAFTGGLRQLGADGYLVFQVTPLLEGMLRAGKRARSTITSAHGHLEVDGVLLGLAGRFVIARLGPRLDVALEGSLNAEWLNVEPHAKAGYEGRAVTERIEWAALGLSSSFRLTEPLWVTTGVCSGWVLSPLQLTDSSESVVGARRWMIGAEVGIGVHF